MTSEEWALEVASTPGRRLRRRLIGLSPTEADFETRGFRGTDPEARARLERVGRAFVAGFNAALEARGIETLTRGLDALPASLRGFGFEGAAMSLALLDRLWPPWNGARVASLLRHVPEHTYLIHVGVGWALARLGRRKATPPRDLDPLLGWLVFDGYGFSSGYFGREWWSEPVARRPSPPLEGIAARIFDQGLGRSLWFSQGADPDAIVDRISTFEPRRAQDLWSGVGLACTYAGGPDPRALERLQRAAGTLSAHLGQGACFAAEARARSGVVPKHTEDAVGVLCRLSVEEAATLCDSTRPVDQQQRFSGDDYEGWRAAIRADLSLRMKSWDEERTPLP